MSRGEKASMFCHFFSNESHFYSHKLLKIEIINVKYRKKMIYITKLRKVWWKRKNVSSKNHTLHKNELQVRKHLNLHQHCKSLFFLFWTAISCYKNRYFSEIFIVLLKVCSLTVFKCLKKSLK